MPDRVLVSNVVAAAEIVKSVDESGLEIGPDEVMEPNTVSYQISWSLIWIKLVIVSCAGADGTGIWAAQ